MDVLKQLEDRTKVVKDNIFRQKKELNRLTADLEENTRRIEAIRLQNIRSNDLKEHLKGISNVFRFFRETYNTVKQFKSPLN